MTSDQNSVLPEVMADEKRYPRYTTYPQGELRRALLIGSAPLPLWISLPRWRTPEGRRWEVDPQIGLSKLGGV